MDLSNNTIIDIFKINRQKLLKKEIKRMPHFTFMTIVFNTKYKQITKFLKNKKHLEKINIIIF